ncbi:MAG: EthD family reductase [Deltaproteobacteria bacterium]|nr:EthD family reductase [Deltaproteobacteria bacterium]MBW1906086.1 EthD family reductase [Deltaproteobacteria bacterium]MBW2159693.1 EthD family reductase [Deltaproteobacteria bacterium]MBW2586859.1 EthD family reductase [Deltaproteobacteria bacterium]MBW2629462.1 EthD family reductase [Deltaproteobacteria bacterium]
MFELISQEVRWRAEAVIIMVKVIVLFGNPIDPPGFDQHFEQVHQPLLGKLPGLQALDINRVSGAAKGDSPFYLIAELCFASEEAMQSGLNSELGQQMARGFGSFASGGVTVLFCESYAAEVG